LSRRIGGLQVSEGRSNDLDGAGRVSGLHKDLSPITPPHARDGGQDRPQYRQAVRLADSTSGCSVL
jgi:hypothetical protein